MYGSLSDVPSSSSLSRLMGSSPPRSDRTEFNDNILGRDKRRMENVEDVNENESKTELESAGIEEGGGINNGGFLESEDEGFVPFLDDSDIHVQNHIQQQRQLKKTNRNNIGLQDSRTLSTGTAVFFSFIFSISLFALYLNNLSTTTDADNHIIITSITNMNSTTV